jgi:hypothetical protein
MPAASLSANEPTPLPLPAVTYSIKKSDVQNFTAIITLGECHGVGACRTRVIVVTCKCS